MMSVCPVKDSVRQPATVVTRDVCPFLDTCGGSCLVSGVTRPVTGVRRQLCHSDDHDRCPVYLAYLLRHSKALLGDRSSYGLR